MALRVAVKRCGRLLTFLLSFGLTFPLAPMAAAQGGAGVALRDTRQSLAALASLLDPTSHQVEALALDLAFSDAAEIVGWVNERIAFESYAGLLRGPQGTLVAGSGNALDQSVLLAKLLNDAGFDARVALGTLEPDDAAVLVLSMFDSVTATERREAPDIAATSAAIAAATGADRRDIEAVITAVAEVSLVDTDVFMEATSVARELLAEFPDSDDNDATAALIEEARQYAWVEYRLGATAAWEDAHPAWPPVSAAPGVTAERHLEGEVPSELLHRLRLEMTIERKRGDVFSTEALMAPWERPIASLLGSTVVIGNTVLGEAGASTFAELGAEAAEAGFYAPVLNGQLAPGAMAFDLQGNLVPPDVAVSAMAGVFQTTAERLGGAIGALDSMGTGASAQEPFALTAQWLDVVLISPDGTETRHRRTVFDRRAPGSREAGTSELLDDSVLLDGIITTYALMATGGRVTPAYVASALAEQAAFHLDVIDDLAALSGVEDEDERSAALLAALADYSPADHLGVFAAFDAVDGVLGAKAYRAEPTVLALVGVLTPTDSMTASSGVDIIANAKRTLRLEGGVVYRDMEAGVLAGVWDTVIEREFVASYGRPVASAMSGPRAAGWQLVTESRPEELAERGVPPEALAAAARELENGYALLVPLPSEESTSFTGSDGGWRYWRIDLATGETLGMVPSGRGGAMAEFITGLKVAGVVNAALAVPSLIQCASSGASWLCYCDVIASGTLLSLAGAIFGALVAAEAALTVYAIVDIAVIAPITTLVTPPVCSVLAYVDDRIRAGESLTATCWAA